MLGLTRSPEKSQRQVVRKDQLHHWRSLHNWVVYLKVLNRVSLFYVKKENWDGQGIGSPRCTHTHLLHAHFSAHSACTITSAHLHACAHTSMAQVSEKVCFVCVSLISVSPSLSHVSPIFAVSVRRISLAFPVRTVLAELTCRLDNCWSQSPHRYAVVVQDLATQWIQSHPCKNKNSQETKKSLRKFLEPSQKPKVIRTIHQNFANPVKNFHGISNVHALSLRNKRNCRTSFTTSKKGNISCIVAIRIGW